MAPRIGTGLGLTETAGFCTYTSVDADVDELAQGIGYDSPLCPISIRDFMKADGTAGAEKPKGEVGEICFSGPQIFLGYLDDLVIIPLGIMLVIRMIPADVLAECRRQSAARRPERYTGP